MAEERRRVLLADGSKIFRMLLSLAMEAKDYDVRTVSSAHSALFALTGCSFDVLVVDMDLPDIEGLELVRRVRAAGVSTPAIILGSNEDCAMVSAAADVETVVACPRTGNVHKLLPLIKGACEHGELRADRSMTRAALSGPAAKTIS